MTHKWVGIVLTLFIFLFALSGIILNHRKLFSGIDVSRNVLPQEYRYRNWNNAAVRGAEKIGGDRVLLYGNIGLWLTDSNFTDFEDFSSGLPQGIDRRKISTVFKRTNGDLLAGTLFGLYRYDSGEGRWRKVRLPIDEERIVDLAEKDGTLLVMSRSHLLRTTDLVDVSVTTLPRPEEYDNRVGLFKTLWTIHSGEIYGLPGMLVVDAIAVIFVFLCISGLVYFFGSLRIKSRKKKKISSAAAIHLVRWNLKWHNKIGWITLVMLLLTTATGIFLRPPLLIAIAAVRVGIIPFSALDSPNPWHDKLRRITFDRESGRYIVATLDGLYYSDDNFESKLRRYRVQPPVSVMGVTVFEPLAGSRLLIGSFAGLFTFNLQSGEVFDYIEKVPYRQVSRRGPPIGDYLVTGYVGDFRNAELYFDFNSGARTISGNRSFVPMPPEIRRQPLSLWNVALEVHTARIYNFIFGSWSTLFIPLAGIIILCILVSGFVVWFTRHRRSSPAGLKQKMPPPGG